MLMLVWPCYPNHRNLAVQNIEHSADAADYAPGEKKGLGAEGTAEEKGVL